MRKSKIPRENAEKKSFFVEFFLDEYVKKYWKLFEWYKKTENELTQDDFLYTILV